MISIAMDNQRFDAVEYIKKLRNAGAPQELAEVQAQEMEHALDNIVRQAKQEVRNGFESKELATKSDLEVAKLELQKEIECVRKEIAQSSTKTIIWIAGLLGSFSVFFLGVLAKGFHWV